MGYLAAARAFLKRIPWQLWAILFFVLLLWGSYLHGAHVERGKWEWKAKQAAIATKAEDAENRREVEEQDDADRKKITELQAKLDALLAHPPAAPAPRIVRVCDEQAASVRTPEADAGVPEASRPTEPRVPDAADPGRELRSLRADLLKFAASCQADNVAAEAAKAQWPK